MIDYIWGQETLISRRCLVLSSCLFLIHWLGTCEIVFSSQGILITTFDLFSCGFGYVDCLLSWGGPEESTNPSLLITPLPRFILNSPCFKLMNNDAITPIISLTHFNFKHVLLHPIWSTIYIYSSSFIIFWYLKLIYGFQTWLFCILNRWVWSLSFYH